MSGWLVLFVIAVAVVVAMQRVGRPGSPRPAFREPRHPDSDGEDDDPGVIPIEDHIDLHGFRPKEIPDVVESYLEAAIEEGHAEVRLIHGRGKGVQRRRVRSLLERHPQVLHYGDAPAHRGGWGATLVQLKLPED